MAYKWDGGKFVSEKDFKEVKGTNKPAKGKTPKKTKEVVEPETVIEPDVEETDVEETEEEITEDDATETDEDTETSDNK